MIHLDNNRCSMFKLNTTHNTTVFTNRSIIDPSIMNYFIKDSSVKKEHYEYYHKTKLYKYNPIMFITDITSNFLEMYGFDHNKDIWYMDVIRYNLDNETNPIDSGLAWHCENDNYPNLITVLMYLRVDEGVKNANLGYIDSSNIKQIIAINTGTIIIMDGQVKHKPEDPIGTGKRDLISISFERK